MPYLHGGTVADTSMTPNKNGLLYAIIGALVVVVAGGGFYLYKMDTATPLMPSPIEAAKPMQTVETGLRMYCMVS